MAAPLSSNPPRTYFSVWQRLMRGYGPLAVLAVLLLLMSLLVPSKVPKNQAVAASGSSADGASGGDTTDSTVAGDTATTAPGATLHTPVDTHRSRAGLQRQDEEER